MMRDSQTLPLIDGGSQDRVSVVRHSALFCSQGKTPECDLDQSGSGDDFLGFHPLHSVSLSSITEHIDEEAGMDQP
jgi:hypothetical protein